MTRSPNIGRGNDAMTPLNLSAHPGPAETTLSNLSPVYELRTPSPTTNRRNELLTVGKPSTLAVSDDIVVMPRPTTQQTGMGKLAPPNGAGHTRGVKSESSSHSAWQKMTKSKKKGSDADATTPATNGLGERLPMDEDLRKGG